MAFALTVAVAGCASDAEGPGGPGTLAVLLETGGPFADAPSDFAVLVVEDAWFGHEVFVREPAQMVVAPGLVVFDQQLPAGSYEVTAAQLVCEMNGGECPEHTGPSDYESSYWQCLTPVTVREGTTTTVIVSEDLGSRLTDRVTCTSTSFE